LIQENGGRIPLNLEANLVDFANNYKIFTPEESSSIEALKAIPPSIGKNTSGSTLPDTAKASLVEGQRTTFANGQVWTLNGGNAVQIK